MSGRNTGRSGGRAGGRVGGGAGSRSAGRNDRLREPGATTNAEVIGMAFVVAAVVLAVGGVNVGIRAGYALEGTATRVPANPFEVLFAVIAGDLAWPTAGTWVLGGGVVLVLAIVMALVVSSRRRRRRRSRVDAASTYMGRGRDIESLTRKSAAASAARLNVTTHAPGGAPSPGVPIGTAIAGGHELFGSYEDQQLDIAGPRTGKTSSRAIPPILAAPGAVLATSNKRDLLDATRDVRAAAGPVWVFDPQGVALEEPTWWWNPLSYVTDEVRAEKLAEHFAAASTGERSDGHFETQGESLLSCCLLAAALDERPITQAYTWLTRPGNEEPAEILRAHDFALSADQMAGIATTADKERAGIYSTARRMAACLTYRHIARWVTDTSPDTSAAGGAGAGGPGRPHFDPNAFVAGGGTLYSLSKEGKGSAGPLVMALTAAVVEAAEDLATRSPGGRLAVPMVGVLDEAANVCRWRQLPDLYSHYGSRGIVLMTFLQSWSQGVEVWGRDGMTKLWSAANVKVYGGGVAETEFLENLSRLIGDYDRVTSSTSRGKGTRSVSRQLQRERIMDVADLAALPRGRAVVLASGNRPTLVRLNPWMAGPHAAAVRASIAAHDPQAAVTLHKVDAGVDELGASGTVSIEKAPT